MTIIISFLAGVVIGAVGQYLRKPKPSKFGHEHIERINKQLMNGDI